MAGHCWLGFMARAWATALVALLVAVAASGDVNSPAPSWPTQFSTQVEHVDIAHQTVTVQVVHYSFVGDNKFERVETVGEDKKIVIRDYAAKKQYDISPTKAECEITIMAGASDHNPNWMVDNPLWLVDAQYNFTDPTFGITSLYRTHGGLDYRDGAFNHLPISLSTPGCGVEDKDDPKCAHAFRKDFVDFLEGPQDESLFDPCEINKQMKCKWKKDSPKPPKSQASGILKAKFEKPDLDCEVR